MLEVVLSGLVTGWAIAIPIGAVGAFLVTLSARTSFRVGAAGALGVASVDGAYAAPFMRDIRTSLETWEEEAY